MLGKKHLTEITILKGTPRSKHGKLKTALAELVKKGYVIRIPHHPDKKYYPQPRTETGNRQSHITITQFLSTV